MKKKKSKSTNKNKFILYSCVGVFLSAVIALTTVLFVKIGALKKAEKESLDAAFQNEQTSVPQEDNVLQSEEETQPDQSFEDTKEPQSQADDTPKVYKHRDMEELEQIVQSRISSSSGDWEVYIKRLGTDEELAVNSHPMCSASLIKLFAMSAAYDDIYSGSLDESGVYQDMSDMITLSSNDAFNSIIWTIGKTRVDEWCAENSYGDTTEHCGLYPAYNADGLELAPDYSNMTSVKDVGRLLTRIYEGKCVGEEASEKMLKLLTAQQIRTKIPAGVPEGVKTANKTGETDDECHDAAIVFSPGADYVIAVMISDPASAWVHEAEIADLSAKVYEFFNTEQ